MANYFENNEDRRRELRKYYREKTNVRLKNAAYVCVGVAIILLGIQIFYVGSMSDRLMLFMRGCTGVLALAFVILAAVRTYRAQSAYFTDKVKSRHDD